MNLSPPSTFPEGDMPVNIITSFTDWLFGVAYSGHSLRLSSPFLYFSLLEYGNKYVISCVIQDEAGTCQRR